MEQRRGQIAVERMEKAKRRADKEQMLAEIGMTKDFGTTTGLQSGTGEELQVGSERRVCCVSNLMQQARRSKGMAEDEVDVSKMCADLAVGLVTMMLAAGRRRCKYSLRYLTSPSLADVEVPSCSWSVASFETTRKTARYLKLVFAGTGEGRDQQAHDDHSRGEERRWLVVTSKASYKMQNNDARLEKTEVGSVRSTSAVSAQQGLAAWAQRRERLSTEYWVPRQFGGFNRCHAWIMSRNNFSVTSTSGQEARGKSRPKRSRHHGGQANAVKEAALQCRGSERGVEMQSVGLGRHDRGRCGHTGGVREGRQQGGEHIHESRYMRDWGFLSGAAVRVRVAVLRCLWLDEGTPRFAASVDVGSLLLVPNLDSHRLLLQLAAANRNGDDIRSGFAGRSLNPRFQHESD
ncbi:hypothetical protein BBK36DRAFT_166389 [Trichoderma citrinoviride]|uniref:Uncharacterized protein n=1 Tax=Trichoderma citrinoviride TaxID=58853 RepID=A0A2T4B7Z4_9HYPO|nr:hypothetical protein BBK36DRAFT_166389 [Trichoderma citrinoviride]PTB65447.1 hypothetical protein BBK36DRAFT_166389 [Trichoderma citrinoviride]